MNPIHDTYQLKMRDGSLLFVEIALTEADSRKYPGMAGFQRLVMERIFKSVKENGYSALDIESMIPINSTDPEARKIIRESGDGMKRLGDFFKLGGDTPERE
jgi:hypothetical protein